MTGSQIAALIFALLLLVPGGCFLFFGMAMSNGMLLFFGVAILGLMGFLFWVAFRKPPPPGADTSAT